MKRGSSFPKPAAWGGTSAGDAPGSASAVDADAIVENDGIAEESKEEKDRPEEILKLKELNPLLKPKCHGVPCQVSQMIA